MTEKGVNMTAAPINSVHSESIGNKLGPYVVSMASKTTTSRPNAPECCGPRRALQWLFRAVGKWPGRSSGIQRAQAHTATGREE